MANLRYWLFLFVNIIQLHANSAEYNVILERERGNLAHTVNLIYITKEKSFITLSNGNEKEAIKYLEVVLGGVIRKEKDLNGTWSKSFNVIVFKVRSDQNKDFKSAGKPFVVKIKEEDGQTTFKSDEFPLNGAREKIFREFFRSQKNRDFKLDEAFGTKDAQKIGGQWKINKKSITESLKNKGLILEDKNINGFFKIHQLKTVKNLECLDIRGEVKCKEFKFAKSPFPNGSSIKSSKVFTRLSGLFPLDILRTCPQTRMEMTHSVDVDFPKGHEIKNIRTQSTKILENNFTELK